MTDESPFGNAVAGSPPSKRRRWLWIVVGIGCAVLFLPCLGLIASLVFPALISSGHSQRDKAEIDLAQISNALVTFQITNDGRIPESLELLVTPDENGMTFLRGYTSVPLDPWGRP